MIRRRRTLLISIVLLISLAPAISMFWASWFAERHDCVLHEGYVNPCIVGGKDWGETLYTAFVMGWLMMLTLPVAATILLVLTLKAAFNLIRRVIRR
ncbi:hypothetical protein [Thalassovita aquimarina]|uniref:Uncharacterized protein n=1 Tax=Thalassovita aquimarina TaxID=2785917 RepID=A0ABS5HQH7_9RHOB|nr:hypothetical protein [Thalassovita aquimarina]MBR9651199.1 hypothetical protein [Thalassovita aquimarina]